VNFLAAVTAIFKPAISSSAQLDRIEAAIAAGRNDVSTLGAKLMTATDNLQAAAARAEGDIAKLIEVATGLVDSNRALADKLTAAVAASDQAAMQGVADALNASADAADKVIADNTPAPPPAVVAPADEATPAA
jgi:uncharacterized phage infection (PIP) family protein YhgE